MNMKNEIIKILWKWSMDGKIDQYSYEDMATELADMVAKNLQPPAVSGALPLAVEFGYKQCEKGNNLEMSLREFNKLNGNDR